MVIRRMIRESIDTTKRIAKNGLERAHSVVPEDSMTGRTIDRAEKAVRRAADSSTAEFRRIERKRAPKTLAIVGLIAVALSSFYLIRLFSALPTLLQSDASDLGETVMSVLVIVLIFFQYLYYVTTVFKLASGMRNAWANMVRLSGSYILLLIITETGLLDFLSVNLVVTNSWILAVVMVCVILYMLLPRIRDFFLPSYEDDPGLRSWILMVFWMDPFKDSDKELEIPLPEDLG